MFASDNNLTVVQNAKILGLTISSNLTWNTHKGELITKATKACTVLCNTSEQGHCPIATHCQYSLTCVRLLLEYCASVLNQALPSYLSKDLKRIQKAALNDVSSLGTVIAIILLALALKPYRVDVNHYVLNSFNKLRSISSSVFAILSSRRHKTSFNQARKGIFLDFDDVT